MASGDEMNQRTSKKRAGYPERAVSPRVSGNGSIDSFTVQKTIQQAKLFSVPLLPGMQNAKVKK